jgi:hypothetical protein
MARVFLAAVVSFLAIRAKTSSSDLAIASEGTRYSPSTFGRTIGPSPLAPPGARSDYSPTIGSGDEARKRRASLTCTQLQGSKQ